MSVCGEMAGDAVYTRLLLGLGLQKFSMTSNNLLAIKDIIVRSNTVNLVNDVAKIIRNEDPDKVDDLLKKLNQI